MVTLFAMSLLLGAEPVRYELSGNELKLEYVKGYLEAKPYISLLRVEVHTDSRGDDQANQSKMRNESERPRPGSTK